MLFSREETIKEVQDRVLGLAEDVDCGIIAPPMNAQVGLDEVARHLLGDDWYTFASNNEQGNTEIVYAIELKYRKRVKRENNLFNRLRKTILKIKLFICDVKLYLLNILGKCIRKVMKKMLPILVNVECEIIEGPLKGTKGRVTAFDYLKNKVIIRIDKNTEVVTVHENVKQ